ncbi:MAG TPA: ATP-binding protein, partial [Ramlibacter sp.]|nr:ATP-binding protein [Ramlibacter sp.]
DGLRRVLVGAASEFTLDYACQAAEPPRWFRMHLVPLRWRGAGAALVMHTDISSESLSAREEILRLNASLERRVQRRTRQLEAANRDLSAFSYSVSHDLKAPLAAIDGFTQVLSERLQGRVDEREASYMQRVRAGVASMFGLIDAMLSLHQLTHETRLHRTRVDVSALADAIVAELRDAEPARPCRLRIERGLAVFGDAGLIGIALRNLIGNSWKFSARVPVMELEVAEDFDGPPGYTTLRVADRGSGFDPAGTEKLFVPFQRLHDAADYPGTGIGLPTVQRIVQRHGGLIRAEGRPGEGATFWVSLPTRLDDPGDSA